MSAVDVVAAVAAISDQTAAVLAVGGAVLGIAVLWPAIGAVKESLGYGGTDDDDADPYGDATFVRCSECGDGYTDDEVEWSYDPTPDAESDSVGVDASWKCPGCGTVNVEV